MVASEGSLLQILFDKFDHILFQNYFRSYIFT